MTASPRSITRNAVAARYVRRRRGRQAAANARTARGARSRQLAWRRARGCSATPRSTLRRKKQLKGEKRAGGGRPLSRAPRLAAVEAAHGGDHRRERQQPRHRRRRSRRRAPSRRARLRCRPHGNRDGSSCGPPDRAHRSRPPTTSPRCSPRRARRRRVGRRHAGSGTRLQETPKARSVSPSVTVLGWLIPRRAPTKPATTLVPVTAGSGAYHVDLGSRELHRAAQRWCRCCVSTKRGSKRTTSPARPPRCAGHPR